MTYNELALDATSKTLLDAYLREPKHAIMLSGASGSGLGTLADSLASEIVQRRSDILMVEADEKGTITIERVRSLYVETRSTRQSKRVVIIDDLDTMSREAQNAFLKLLEEPTPQTFFILTSHQPQKLLPTITSRAQSIEIRPISSSLSQKMLKNASISDDLKLQQMLFIASGLPAELSRIASNEQYFAEQAEFMRVARSLVQLKLYDRLVVIAKYTDRAKAQELVEVLGRLVGFMLTRSPDDKLFAMVDAIELTAQRLQANGHVKSQLMNLMVRM